MGTLMGCFDYIGQYIIHRIINQSINQSFKALSPVQGVAKKGICKFMKKLYKRVRGLGIIKLLTENKYIHTYIHT